MRTSLLKKICSVSGMLCLAFACMVIADAAEISSVTSGDVEIGYWAPCVNELTIKLSEDVADTEQISLTDLGTSLLYDEAESIELSVTGSEGAELTVLLSETLTEGHRYKLEVGDSEILFKATESNGVTASSDRVDFEGLTNEDLNNSPTERPEKDTYVVGESGLMITKTAGETRISIADNTLSTGENGLKVDGRGTIDKAFLQGTAFWNGKLKIEARIKVVSGTFKLGLGSETGVVNLLTADSSSAKLSYQNSTSTSSGIKNKTVNAPENGYTTISYEMDLDNKSVLYTVNGGDGVLESGKMPYISSKGNILNDGIEFIQLEGSPSSSEYIIDYVTTTIYKDAMDIKGIKLKDINDAEVSVTKDTAVTPGIKEIDIIFNTAVMPDTLSGITVSDSDGLAVPAEGEYDDMSCTYKLSLTEYLGQFEGYFVDIPRNILAIDGSGLIYDYSERIETGDGETAVASFKFTDKNGKPIGSMYELGDSLVVTAEIVNTKQSKGKMSIVYTEGKDKLMTKMMYQDFELNPDDRKAEFSFGIDIEKGEEISEINAFLWNNLKEHIPLCRAVLLR